MKPFHSLIECTPGVSGGRPCLAGTGMPVVQIAVHYHRGESPERILRRYPHLDLQRIHAAIACYLLNQAEMDAELAFDAEQFKQAKRAQKLSARGG